MTGNARPAAGPPGPRAGGPKLIRGLGLKAKLGGGAVAVLGVGALLAPRSVREAPPAEEKVAPILQAEVQRREPARAFRGVQDTGRRALAFTVAFPAPSLPEPPTVADFARPRPDPLPPDGFGVVVGPERVLAHAGALRGRREAVLRLADGRAVRGRVLAHEPETGLVLVHLESAAAMEVPRIAVEPPVPGELAVAAARMDGRDLVAPVFIASTGPDRYTISAASGLVATGMPIFTLAGEALAVAAGRPWLYVAYPVAESAARLARLAESGRGLPLSVGVLLQPLTPTLARSFGENGALVADVARDSPAARAGLTPGDVIVRIAGQPVHGLEDALERIASLKAGRAAPVVVRRRGKEAEMSVAPEAVLVPEVPGAPEPPPGAPRCRDALPAEALAAAGIPEEAVVLAVANRAVTARTLGAALRGTRSPVLLRLQHGPRRFFAAVEKPS